MNIIITGASSGIGYQTAVEIAHTGEHSIAVISRNEEKLQALKTDIELTTKSKVYVLSFDLANGNFNVLLSQIEKHFKLSERNYIDVLVNNAGYLVNKPFVDLTMDDWQNTFDVNLFSSVKLIKMLFPYFNRKASSHIVNIASMGGVQGTIKFPGLSAYSSSKAAVNVFTESLAAEFQDENIKVNAINPGAVGTPMLNKAFPGYNAPVTAQQMGNYIAQFALTGHNLMNGRVIQVSLSN